MMKSIPLISWHTKFYDTKHQIARLLSIARISLVCNKIFSNKTNLQRFGLTVMYRYTFTIQQSKALPFCPAQPSRPCAAAARYRRLEFKNQKYYVYLRLVSCPCTEYVTNKTNAKEKSNRKAMIDARPLGAKWFHALHTVSLY